MYGRPAPTTSFSTVAAKARPGGGVGRGPPPAAELTKAANVRKAQKASGRRLQGANGPAEASDTRLNGRASWMRGPPFWREIAARCTKRDGRAGARGCTVQVSRARRAASAAHRSRARALGCLRASQDSLGHPRRAQAVPRSS